jgi:hypothetical protein
VVDFSYSWTWFILDLRHLVRVILLKDLDVPLIFFLLLETSNKTCTFSDVAHIFDVPVDPLESVIVVP